MGGGLVLGVDAGNSKTVALVAGRDGAVVGAGRGGRGDIYGGPSEDAALAEVDCAVGTALAAAGAVPADIGAAVFSMAGADWPEDFDLLGAAVAARGWGATRTVVNDAIGALWAGSVDGVGVALAAGTGLAMGARGPSGAAWHSGHWPTGGGGAGLGKAALQAVYRAELGVGPATSLTGRVVAFFGVASVEDVLYRVSRRRSTWNWKDDARLAPLVLDAAEAGDAVAVAIADELGHRLGEYAAAAARRVGLGAAPFPLVLTGGVFRHPSRAYAAAVVDAVAAALPGVRPVASALEPVAGALALALAESGVPPTAALRDRIAATMPPAALFATRTGCGRMEDGAGAGEPSPGP